MTASDRNEASTESVLPEQEWIVRHFAHMGRLTPLHDGVQRRVFHLTTPEGAQSVLKVCRAEQKPEWLRTEWRLVGRIRAERVPVVLSAGLLPAGGAQRAWLEESLAPGTSLEQQLSSTRILPVARVRALAQGLLPLLTQVHDAGVLHGDVNPHNLVSTESGAPWLIDFGNARDFGQATHADGGAFSFTVGYAAPEQVRTIAGLGEAAVQSALGAAQELDARADLFGLGMVLFRALTGDNPLLAPHLKLEEAARKTVLEPVPVPTPEQVPDEPLRQLVAALTQRNPRLRPPDARAALALLEQADL